MDLKDERGMVLSWLARLVLAVAVVGTLLYDTAAVGVNYFALDADASEMALELSNVGGNHPANPWPLERAARDLARDAGAKLVSVRSEPERQVVFLKIKRQANTLLLDRIGPLAEWATATATGRASTE